MFTGIIEEMGSVVSVSMGGESSKIRISASKILEDLHTGDSIAVNGICLTAVSFDRQGFTADVMNETFRRSTLKDLRPKDPVNLERAVSAVGRFGGHIVAGHVDGTGTVLSVKQDANAVWFTVEAAPGIMRYCIKKGSVAIDGISLTIAETGSSWFQVSVIPHTLKQTVLGSKKPGDAVNLENDMIGKYVEKLLEPEAEEKSRGVTEEMLMNAGF
ncbi:riboflavin synthase [Anaerostipes sp.]|uniref:riboflavin synthase n=1 Tax=Anaerostipes sp. TaxID=1872530 RepID=UPI0025C60ADA|nr:riboflavin synthase [Anaerostipes sp.]MBS7007649.1 riboflavin synthase [Anaerostipes sp.]